MSIEKVTKVVGYQVRCCKCGVAGPLGDTWDDAGNQAEAHGWEVNSIHAQTSVEDFCPVCYQRREEELDRKIEEQNREGWYPPSFEPRLRTQDD